MTTDVAQPGTAAAPLRAVVAELVRGGVRDVVICPGSRSTPLALALRAEPRLHCWVHLDERSGAFFALGAARARRRPVAVLATSGTAVVNFGPAVAEARYGRVPLLLLTADRPPELHDVGAPQTIDQSSLYGFHAKASMALAIPGVTARAEAAAGSIIREAIDMATASPRGPVQVNAPFREPLLPDGPLTDPASLGERPLPHVEEPDPSAVERAVGLLAGASRGLIVCGPAEAPGLAPVVLDLARAAGVPLLADVLSGVRTAEAPDPSPLVSRYDLLLRSDGFRAAHEPDAILRFGARPTSKLLDGILEASAAAQAVVDDGGGWNVPAGPDLIEAEPVALASAAAAALGDRESTAAPGWLDDWRMADDLADRALRTWQASLSETFEGAVAAALAEALQADTIVLAGNSMPVRDLDMFMPPSRKGLRIIGNRGASGIDGQISTALGVAASADSPVVAVVGDIGFIHDLNALVAARRLGIDAVIVLVNNDGGGIFSFLPQAAADRADLGLPQHYEELFGTPHGLEFGPVVRALGAAHELVDHASLPSALAAAVTRPGLDVLELRTRRDRNVELHTEAVAAVLAALDAV